MARCCYDEQILHQRETPSAKDWIRKYNKEENRGLILIHRERRLKEIANEEGPIDRPPKYEIISPSLDEQITECRQQYWLHLQELAKLETEKPKAAAIDQWEMLRRVKNRQGKSIAWEEASVTCAALGGCCGRDCGCCKKPLEGFLAPTGSSHEKAKSKSYGHCTVECPCCIRFRGFYKPDASVRLPEFEPGPSRSSEPHDGSD